MYADRYAKPTLKPGSLGVALAINGAVIAALFYSAPEVFKLPDPGLIIRNIPIEPPPPPLPEPKPRIDPRTANPNPAPPRPIAPDPIVKTIPTGPVVGPTPFDPGPISDGGGVAVDPPRPVPVMTGPRMDPRYAAAFQPVYPAEERRAGNSGRVLVRVLVGTDGRVKQIERINAPSDAFYETTMRRALDKWRFKPATRDGTPIEQWFTVGVSFVLND